MTPRTRTASSLCLTLGLTLFGADALAQNTFGGGGSSFVMPYYVSQVSAWAEQHPNAGMSQELRPAHGSTPERFVLHLVVDDSSNIGELTLTNSSHIIDSRKKYRLHLVLDNPAQHATLYRYLLSCSSLAGSSLEGFRGSKPPFPGRLGRFSIKLEALPAHAMSLNRINSKGELTINLTHLSYGALKCY